MQNKPSNTESGANGHGAGPASTALAKADGAASGVSREFHNVVADIEDLVKATTSFTGEELARARAKLGERVGAAKQSVEDMGGAIADRARKSAAVTNEYVHEQPWQAIGICAGAGAAVGLLLGIVLTRRAYRQAP